MRSSFPFALLVLAAACSSSSGGSGGESIPPPDPNAPALLGYDCDPMVPTQCGFPFPSNVYTIDDPAMPTGKRVAFGKTTLPAYKPDTHSDPSAWSDLDGFSPGQAPMTHMPGATVTGLPTQDTIEKSIAPDTPTVLLDTSTGQLVPHFAELDMSYFDDEHRALMIRPVVRLKDATRYIVAFRHVKGVDGNDLPPSDVFKALRDGTPSDHPAVVRRRALYDDVFGKLAAAGIDKKDLQIAWDYTTASKDTHTRALIHMRDDALATVGDEGPTYRIVDSQDDPNPHIKRRIHGMMTVPVYLDQPDAGASLVLGPDGLPKQNGTAEFAFTVQIPNSATTGTPGAILQNGHGLFGHQSEGENGYLATIADAGDYVTIAVDLIGMDSTDGNWIANAIAGDMGGFKHAVDRQHQGLVNELLAMRMMKGRFWKDPLVQFAGKSAIDPSRCYYRGDSQGGIFGTTYMAISTDVTRGLLGEPGLPYNLLLNRSSDASGFFLILHSVYRDAMDVQIALALAQMFWDRTEPDGYVPYITENTLPNTPSHNVLLHVAIGDHQVTPLGAHIIARTVGAKNVEPVNREIFGIPDAAPPLTGNAMVEWDFGLPISPTTNTPPSEGDDPHDKVRVLPAAIQQSIQFFTDGTVKQFCDPAPCKGM